MIFKQGILKEEIIKFLIAVILSFIPLSVVTIVGIVRCEIQAIMVFSLIFSLPLFSLTLLLGLTNLEWFYIYEDRIEARYIFGVKNVVYFDDVLDVQQVKINLTTRGMEKEFYIFNDGRKNNKSFFNINSCYNKKEFNLRIYKTPELENIINIKITIQDGKRCND